MTEGYEEVRGEGSQFPETWNPIKEGEFIEGKYESKTENVGPHESNQYTLVTPKKSLRVWGCTILDDAMTKCKVGDILRITFKGVGKATKGYPPKIFKVERKTSGNSNHDDTKEQEALIQKLIGICKENRNTPEADIVETINQHFPNTTEAHRAEMLAKIKDALK